MAVPALQGPLASCSATRRNLETPPFLRWHCGNKAGSSLEVRTPGPAHLGHRLSHVWDSVYCNRRPLLRAKEDSWTFGMSPDERRYRRQLYHVQSTKSRQSMRNWRNAFGKPSPNLDTTPTAKPGH